MSKKIDMIKIKQKFNNNKIKDIPDYIREEFNKSDLQDRVKQGNKIGITVGSRGISNMSTIVKILIEEIEQLGADPYILPAMGSHGGGTSEGQEGVLASYGITEDSTGGTILSSMETMKLGEVDQGVPVYFSKSAMKLDGIIALNRIKKHTDFTSDRMESGICKVLVIGLGKAKGAQSIHKLGVYGLKNVIPRAAELILEKAPVIQGIGILENGYEETCKIKFIPPEKIKQTEAELLKESKELLPSLPVDQIDILIVQEMGKNISGTGLDTNVIGRLNINGVSDMDKPVISKIAVLDLTEESHGNALGIGLTDITTRKLVDRIDKETMYKNLFTSTFLNRGKIPITMDTEEKVVDIALRTCWQPDINKVKLIIIKNTLEIDEMYVSKAAWNKINENKDVEAISDWGKLEFDEDGRIINKL